MNKFCWLLLSAMFPAVFVMVAVSLHHHLNL
jgi:hypothetical protein